MSAFVVCDSHISAILQAVFNATKRHTFSGMANPWKYQGDEKAYHYCAFALEESQSQANVLMLENLRSVNWRYRNSPHIEQQPMVGQVQLSLTAEPVSVLQALKLIDCLAYQSCETDNWDETEAYKLLNKYREILIPCLDGYDSAKWAM